MKKRLVYLGLTFVLLAVEVLIALFVHDNFIRPYIGDVLVTVLVCAFLRIFIPKGVKPLPLYVKIQTSEWCISPRPMYSPSKEYLYN